MTRAGALSLVAAITVHSLSGAGAAQTRGIPELMTELRAADPVARARAACDLRKQDDRTGVPVEPLLLLLGDATPVDASACGNRSRGMGPDNLTTPGGEAAVTLAALRTRAVDPLIGALGSDSWITRRNATWALGRIRDPRARDAVLPMLHDPDARVRREAAWALGTLGK